MEQDIETKVQSVMTLAKTVEELEAALAENEQFQHFIQAQKQFTEESSKVWKEVETAMIDNDVKSVKGPWGSITIVEKPNYSADDLAAVPSKFVKKQLDTTKVGNFFKLEGTLPKGVTKTVSKFLMKRLK